MSADTNLKTLVITPMQEERDFFLQRCVSSGLQEEHAHIGRLPVVHLAALNVTLAVGGCGKAQFAIQTQHLLDAGGAWELVICTGGAGALADELRVGDVVVATATVEHDYRNLFNVRPMPRFAGALDALAALQRVTLREHAFNVHFGAVASGDEDIVSDERRRVIREQTGAIAVAWEGAGVARACAFSNIPFLEIRGITDAANHTAASDFETNLEVAMGNVAALIADWKRTIIADED